MSVLTLCATFKSFFSLSHWFLNSATLLFAWLSLSCREAISELSYKTDESMVGITYCSVLVIYNLFSTLSITFCTILQWNATNSNLVNSVTPKKSWFWSFTITWLDPPPSPPPQLKPFFFPLGVWFSKVQGFFVWVQKFVYEWLGSYQYLFWVWWLWFNFLLFTRLFWVTL